MKTNKQFISVDWGTTNFRLRLVDRETEDILFDYKTDHGILKTYDEFLQQDTLSQTDYFADHLRKIIVDIPHDISHLPILLSGMASSTIGLRELPYAEFPFSKTGESLIWENVELNNEMNLILVSGVKSNSGMIRGEEIQAIGLAEFMNHDGRSILVLPGTHSKHMTFENGAFTKLRNYMTGELFDVLSQHSILAKSVEPGKLDDSLKAQFLRAVNASIEGELSANLLSVRANDVIHNMSANQNYYYLSGLVIGAELRDFVGSDDFVYLAASEPLFSLYKLALEHIGSKEKVGFFDDAMSDQALVKGHVKILRQFEKARQE